MGSGRRRYEAEAGDRGGGTGGPEVAALCEHVRASVCNIGPSPGPGVLYHNFDATSRRRQHRCLAHRQCLRLERPRRRQQPHPQPAPSSASGGLLRLHRPALAGGAARLAAAARGRTGATRHPPTPIRALGPDAASLANRRRRERHRCFETRTFRSERFGRAPLRPHRQRRRLWRRWPTKRAASAGDARTDQIQ